MQGSPIVEEIHEADVQRAAASPPKRVQQEPELVQRPDICAGQTP